MLTMHNCCMLKHFKCFKCNCESILRALCISVYMCIDTHLDLDIFSEGKFFLFIYLFLESYQSGKSYNNVI